MAASKIAVVITFAAAVSGGPPVYTDIYDFIRPEDPNYFICRDMFPVVISGAGGKGLMHYNDVDETFNVLAAACVFGAKSTLSSIWDVTGTPEFGTTATEWCNFVDGGPVDVITSVGAAITVDAYDSIVTGTSPGWETAYFSFYSLQSLASFVRGVPAFGTGTGIYEFTGSGAVTSQDELESACIVGFNAGLAVVGRQLCAFDPRRATGTNRPGEPPFNMAALELIQDRLCDGDDAALDTRNKVSKKGKGAKAKKGKKSSTSNTAPVAVGALGGGVLVGIVVALTNRLNKKQENTARPKLVV